MFDEAAIINEFTFKAIKSSGPGGQHVNKTASKVELVFNISTSKALTDYQKDLLVKKLASRLTKENALVMQSGEFRSQFKNKSDVIQRCINLLKTNLKEPKPRKPTKVPKGVQKKRMESKRKQSEKKAQRKPPKLDL